MPEKNLVFVNYKFLILGSDEEELKNPQSITYDEFQK